MINNAVNWIRRAKLRDWIKLLKKLLPHVAIIISGMLVVFFVIDRVNKPMGFMTNEFHKRITFVLALLAIYFSIQIITIQRRIERAEYKRRQRAQAERARASRPSATSNTGKGVRRP
ncbi:MAG: hypothetical protein IJJ23_05060 [Clostridia bacterium]|nr:hypothetical protein [Clostridia bacterium]